MKILLTGANGVVGQHLLPFLNDNPDVEEIIGISRNARYYYGAHPQRNKVKYIEAESHLEDKLWVARLISEIKPDMIINLAAVSTSSSPAHEVWKNTNITLNLLDSCVMFNQGVKFLQASSMSVEGYPTSVYSASKLACESLVASYTDLNDNIQGMSVRFPAVVGKGNRHGLLIDLISKLRSDSEVIALFGNYPGSRKPFIYAKNLADIINQLLFDVKQCFWTWCSPMTICPVDNLTVEEVARIVMRKLNINKPIIWDSTKVWKGDQKAIEPNPLFTLIHFRNQILHSEMAVSMAVEEIINE